MQHFLRTDTFRVDVDTTPPLHDFTQAAPMPSTSSRIYSHPLTWQTAKPWPSAQPPASGLGYLPPYDREFARRAGDEYPAIGWQNHWREPWWAQKDVQAFAKEHEFNLRFQTPQSRMHELNQFSPAFVAQPPQTLYEIPNPH